MAQNSKIEWTEATWNPVTGCSKISAGCTNCYAERIAYRFAGIHGFPDRPHHFKITLHPERIDQPLRWKKPRMVFVNSMSDLFHEEIPESFIFKVFETMKNANQHTFQVLTKRSKRMINICSGIRIPDNVWLGVSVERADYLSRIDNLRLINSKIRFVSMEPLLGSLGALNLKDIHWVIVGGESGPNSRPMEKAWVLRIKEQCEIQDVAFFFKQWGGVNKKKNGRKLLGQTWNEMPISTQPA